MNQYNIGDSLNFNFYVSNQLEGAAKTWISELKIVGHRQLSQEENYDDFFNEDVSIDIGDKLSDAMFLDINGQSKISCQFRVNTEALIEAEPIVSASLSVSGYEMTRGPSGLELPSLRLARIVEQ